MTPSKLLPVAVGLCLAVSISVIHAGDEGKTVGRVRVTTLLGGADASTDAVGAALASQFAPPQGKRFPDKRIISIRPRSGEPARFDATIYDYTVEKAFDLVVDLKGREIGRKEIPEQPARSMDELADASTIVRENQAFAEALATGALMIYEPMPAITVDADGRRRVNVGVMTPSTAGASMKTNEIVSVHIPTASIARYPSGAPDSSRAQLLACGPNTSGCSYSITQPCSYYQVSWPTTSPVWKLNIRHPSCTTSVQSNGTGLELTNVYYQGRLILKRAEVPVLNVLYSGNTCGPYRDWLYSEDCFNAPGTDVPVSGSGIRVASSSPSTLCESGSDAGNFHGIAIFDQGDALWLMTETNAGWYRYVMEWRLHLDGTIEPIFGFGATTNSCTCNLHYHHAYWRLEWAIDAVSDGTNDDPATGINTLERRVAGSQDDYTQVAAEGTFVRPASGGDKDYFRIKNVATGDGYILEPGALDGTAYNDSYGKWDLAALALNAGEIDDPNSNTSINVDPWINGEALGDTKRLVTWYHATYTHNDPNGTGEACELAGPRLVPLNPCAGSIAIDRNAYTCSSTVSVTLNDSDLANTGTATLGVTSATEPVPEPLVLTESPAGSGRFVGTIATSTGPPANGDGKISVVDGDSIDVHYVDASSCGTPNVPVDKIAAIDCSAPVISAVQVVPGTSTATVSWTTNEPASGVVHYGTTVPTTLTAASTGTSLTHAVTLTGLSDCTTYYYWVESADVAGNVAASNGGGGYYAFTTAQSHAVSFTSTDTPIAIPDNNPTGATSTINVADSSLVQDVNVTANISHTYDGDLVLSLITPSSTSILLSNRHGGSGNNFQGTIFDDEAATAIGSGSPPFAGSYRPDTPLSAADGQSAAGSWRFKVVDQAAIDTGTINSWTLSLVFPSQTCPSSGNPPPVPDGSFGTGMTVSQFTGAVSGLHLTWDTTSCPAKNAHLLYGTLQNVASYALDGAVCGLGPLGSYDWVGAPSGDLWFVVVGDDAVSTEGTWGTDSVGQDRGGTTASGYCGFAARNNTGTCP